MPLAPTLDQLRGHPQLTESPVNQRPDVNPLTARAPRNPFGPQPFSPPAVPGWGGALTQPRPVGPQGHQVQYVPGLMPWSGPRPWSGAPIAAVIPRGQRFNPGAPFAPVIPRGQRFNPGSPVPSPIDPTAILRSVSGPRQSPTGAGIFPGVFEHQRGGVRPDPLRPDRGTVLAPEIDQAVRMGYIADPRFARFTYAARTGAPGKGVRGGFIAAKHEAGWANPWEDSRLNPDALEEFHDMESNRVRSLPIRFRPTPTRARMGANRI